MTGDSIARICVVPSNILPARVNQHVCILRVDEDKVNPIFIYCQLFGKKELLLSLSSVGATRKELTKTMSESIDIELPDRCYQNVVVEFLCRMQEKLAINAKIDSNLGGITIAC